MEGPADTCKPYKALSAVIKTETQSSGLLSCMDTELKLSHAQLFGRCHNCSEKVRQQAGGSSTCSTKARTKGVSPTPEPAGFGNLRQSSSGPRVAVDQDITGPQRPKLKTAARAALGFSCVCQALSHDLPQKQTNQQKSKTESPPTQDSSFIYELFIYELA